jgi:hypothetical protein
MRKLAGIFRSPGFEEGYQRGDLSFDIVFAEKIPGCQHRNDGKENLKNQVTEVGVGVCPGTSREAKDHFQNENQNQKNHMCFLGFLPQFTTSQP